MRCRVINSWWWGMVADNDTAKCFHNLLIKWGYFSGIVFPQDVIIFSKKILQESNCTDVVDFKQFQRISEKRTQDYI
jgi:hypothetical protein